MTYISAKQLFQTVAASIVLMAVAITAVAAVPGNAAKNSPNNASVNTKATHKYKPDELLVKLKPSVGKFSLSAAKHRSNIEITSTKRFAKLKNEKGKQANGLKHKASSLDRWQVIKLTKGTNLEEAITILSEDPDIEMVQYNYKVEAQATPNDPLFNSLWGLQNLQQSGGLFDADIDATDAWDSTTVIQVSLLQCSTSGVDYGHEDLADNMWINTGEIPGNMIRR